MMEDTQGRKELYHAIGHQDGNEAMSLLIKFCWPSELSKIYKVIYPPGGTLFSEEMWKLGNLLLIFDGTIGGDTAVVLESFRNVIVCLVKDRLASESVDLAQSLSPSLIPDHQSVILQLAAEDVERNTVLDETIAAKVEDGQKDLRELEFYRNLKLLLGGGTTLGIMVFLSRNPELIDVIKNILKPVIDGTTQLVSSPPTSSNGSMIVVDAKGPEPTTYLAITRAYRVFLNFCWRYLES
jgi:hypothetical protein